MKETLTRYANKDLATARKAGLMAIVGLKVGNVEVSYNNGQYMIVDFNNSAFAHYVGAKKGAVEFLVNNYEVINE